MEAMIAVFATIGITVVVILVGVGAAVIKDKLSK